MIGFDARMVHHSGIGTHLRGLISGLLEQKSLTPAAVPEFLFLGKEELLRLYPRFSKLGSIREWSAPVYSMAEQLGMPCAGQVEAFHFPHYSVPQRLRPRRPYLVTIHDVIHFRVPGAGGSCLRRTGGAMVLRSALKRARIITTVSEFSRSDLAQFAGVEEDRIEVLPNAVETDFRPFSRADVERIRSRLGLPPKFLLAMGSGKPHKNLPFLISAFDHWRTTSSAAPELDLVICGAARAEQPGVLAAAQTLGSKGLANVRFVDWIDRNDLPALYQAAEALVFPSLYEGFGLPVLEAQRVGTPVITSSATAIAEVAGDGALLFDPRSRSELISRLNEYFGAAEAQRDDLIAAGSRNEERYCWRTTATKLLSLYERLRN